VDVVSEEAVIAWLNVAETVVLTLTPEAALPGVIDVTMGGTSAAAVVKLHESFAASVVPEVFAAVVVMVAVYCVL
jgi:hypothetical protein